MAKHNVWISVSDLMTGLMVIFLFVAISYMQDVKNNQSVLTEYVEIKTKLHEKLVNEFAGDTLKWQMSIGKDLTMKFKNPTVLFDEGSSELSENFKQILDEFLPKYFDILLKDNLRRRIKEIRIEGHTDTKGMLSKDPDPYIANVMLSQERALSVLRYYRNMPQFRALELEDRHTLEFWLTANGLSYGKALDDDGDYEYHSHKPINPTLSRRVEFRIVTTGDEVLENFVNKNQ